MSKEFKESEAGPLNVGYVLLDYMVSISPKLF